MNNDNTKRFNVNDLHKVLDKILENSINIKVIEFEHNKFDGYSFILKNKPGYKLSIIEYFNRDGMQIYLLLHLPNGNTYCSDDYYTLDKSKIYLMLNKVYELVEELYKNEDRSLLNKFLM